jgi:hypothetical protein
MAEAEPDWTVEAMNLRKPSEADIQAAYTALRISMMREAPVNHTICGIHSQLWKATVGLPDGEREAAQYLIATAYVMGKKMYYRLRELQRSTT